MPDMDDIGRQTKLKLTRLKEIGEGVRVSRVLGQNLLVKTIVPKTELDEVTKRGALYIPEHIKKDYTPLPSTGIVLGVGEGVGCRYCKFERLDPIHTDTFAGEPHPFEAILNEGDMIIFPKIGGMDVNIAEQDLRLIDIRQVLAVLSDTDESVVEVKDA